MVDGGSYISIGDMYKGNKIILPDRWKGKGLSVSRASGRYLLSIIVRCRNAGVRSGNMCTMYYVEEAVQVGINFCEATSNTVWIRIFQTGIRGSNFFRDRFTCVQDVKDPQSETAASSISASASTYLDR